MLLVGLGRAGALALAVLIERPDVEIVAAVDPRGRRVPARPPIGIPVSRSLDGAGLPDLAIVSTPTPSHVGVCLDLLDRYPGLELILCEKPAALAASDLAALHVRARERHAELRVLLHYAFSGEVLWLADRIGEFAEVASFEARFEDPYRDSLAGATATLSCSWADSGINALSVLTRLVQLEAVVTATASGVTDHVATVSFRSGDRAGVGTIATSWEVEASRKQTALTLVDGTTIELEHDAGTVSVNGDEIYRRAGTDPRLERYRTMLRAHLDDVASVPDERTTLHLHALLSAGLTGGLDGPAA